MSALTTAPVSAPEPVRILNVDTALVNPASLTLADRNPRRGDVQELVKSFRTNGFWGTVIVDRATGQVLAGNHRVKAARELAMPEIPVSYIQTDDPAHAKRILLADNRLSDIASNDVATLAELLTELQEAPGGLDGTGYTELDLAQFVAELGDGAFQEGLIDEDEVPELPEDDQVVSREGDIWQVGPHRVGCGSSTSAEHVARLMNGVFAKLVWTDPPYNVDYEGKTKDRLKIANDAMTPEQFQVFLGALFKTTLDVAAPGACIYVAYAEVEAQNFHGQLRAAGWKYSQTMIWVKNAAVMGRQDYNWRHEPILYGWKPGAGHFFNRDFTQTTVLDEAPNYKKMGKDELVALLEGQRDALATTVVYEDKPSRNDLHPTMKPCRLVTRMIVASSLPGWLVYDPCAGSGTTGVAAHKTNRASCLNDLDPKYVDRIVDRLQQFTGLKAVRQDGQGFDALRAEKGMNA